MRLRNKPLVQVSVFAAILLSAFAAHAQTANPNATLTITGAVSTPLTLSAGDLKTMPRKKLTVTNPHNKKTEAYEGVSLEELLHRAGVPHGEQLRGPAMATYVIAEAEDGYRAVFALAELDSGILDSEILVADTMNGSPLGAKEGPFKIVAPHEKRPARWVRMLKSITVINAQAS